MNMSEKTDIIQDYDTLQELGFPITLTTQSYVQECIDAAVKTICTNILSKETLIKVVHKLLGCIKEDKYSPVWVLLLDKLACLNQDEEVLETYKLLLKQLDGILLKGSTPLPRPVVHCLWLTHLPSLEHVVLRLVQAAASFPEDECDVQVQHLIETVYLSSVSSIEPVIKYGVESMLNRISQLTDSSDVLQRVKDIFERSVQDKGRGISFVS